MDSILGQRWYTVDYTWLHSDQTTYVIAGHPDPHVGAVVCYGDDLMDDIEEGTEGERIAEVNAVLQHIVDVHNASLEPNQ